MYFQHVLIMSIIYIASSFRSMRSTQKTKPVSSFHRCMTFRCSPTMRRPFTTWWLRCRVGPTQKWRYVLRYHHHATTCAMSDCTLKQFVCDAGSFCGMMFIKQFVRGVSISAHVVVSLCYDEFVACLYFMYIHQLPTLLSNSTPTKALRANNPLNIMMYIYNSSTQYRSRWPIR